FQASSRSASSNVASRRRTRGLSGSGVIGFRVSPMGHRPVGPGWNARASDESRYDRAMSPERRDAVGRRQIAPSWESLVERQIREAMDAGAFDELPFVGQRLPIEDDSAAGEWAMAHRMLKNAGVAPPWIESDKEARRLLAAREEVLQRARHASLASRARLRSEFLGIVAAA